MKQLNHIDDLIRADGKINSAILRQAWFKTSNLYHDITSKGLELGGSIDNILELIHLYKTQIPRPSCQYCSKLSKFHSGKNQYLNHCGSRSCSAKSISNQVIKTKRKMYDGYGTSPLARKLAKDRAGDLNRKGRQTLKERYGIDNPGQLIDHQLKVRQTLLNRYQVDHPAKIDYVKNLRLVDQIAFYNSLSTGVTVINLVAPSTFKLESYDNPCPLVLFNCTEHGEELLPTETFKWRARKFSTTCSKCLRPYSNASIAQLEIVSFIESLGFECLVNDRSIIHPLELDIVIKSKKIAIEYHGLFWHSSDDLIDKKQHLIKTNLAEAVGFQLIQIFEDEWMHKRDIVKSIIASKLGVTRRIFARKCDLRDVDNAEAKKFLEENHIQGSVNSSKRLGLYFNDELVSIATLGRSRFKKDEIELLRFCSVKGVTVVGGLSKLLSIVQVPITSYADRRFSNGNGYLKVGFKIVDLTSPSYFYTDLNSRYNRLGFQKHKLKDKLNNYDPRLTEHENMINAGFRIIWDAGHLKLLKG